MVSWTDFGRKWSKSVRFRNRRATDLAAFSTYPAMDLTLDRLIIYRP